jgi:hypothetical protein
MANHSRVLVGRGVHPPSAAQEARNNQNSGAWGDSGGSGGGGGGAAGSPAHPRRSPGWGGEDEDEDAFAAVQQAVSEAYDKLSGKIRRKIRRGKEEIKVSHEWGHSASGVTQCVGSLSEWGRSAGLHAAAPTYPLMLLL